MSTHESENAGFFERTLGLNKSDGLHGSNTWKMIVNLSTWCTHLDEESSVRQRATQIEGWHGQIGHITNAVLESDEGCHPLMVSE